MAKIILFLAGALISALNAYPLNENLSTPVIDSTTSHDLKVNSLTGQQQHHKSKDDVSDGTTKSDDNSTEQTYIEETFIEVLLPGNPQVNTSILESLYNASSMNNTQDRPKRGSKDTQGDSIVTNSGTLESSTNRTVVPGLYAQEASVQNRHVRDTPSSVYPNSQYNTSEEKSPVPSGQDQVTSSIENSTENAPAKKSPYAASNRQSGLNRPTRDTSTENGDINENSSEKQSPSYYGSTVGPTLYSTRNAQSEPNQPARDSLTETSNLNENSSKNTSTSYGSTVAPTLYYANNFQSEQKRAVRDASENVSEKNPPFNGSTAVPTLGSEQINAGNRPATVDTGNFNQKLSEKKLLNHDSTEASTSYAPSNALSAGQSRPVRDSSSEKPKASTSNGLAQSSGTNVGPALHSASAARPNLPVLSNTDITKNAQSKEKEKLAESRLPLTQNSVPSTPNSQIRLIRDASSEGDSGEVSSEDRSSSTTTSDKRIEGKPKNEEDSSSSEEAFKENHNDSISTSSHNSRAARNTNEDDNAAVSGDPTNERVSLVTSEANVHNKNAEEKERSSLKTDSSTETVVFITPQAKIN